jgi:hypothetical protein
VPVEWCNCHTKDNNRDTTYTLYSTIQLLVPGVLLPCLWHALGASLGFSRALQSKDASYSTHSSLTQLFPQLMTLLFGHILVDVIYNIPCIWIHSICTNVFMNKHAWPLFGCFRHDECRHQWNMTNPSSLEHVHPKLRNINLHNVTYSLTPRNP